MKGMKIGVLMTMLIAGLLVMAGSAAAKGMIKSTDSSGTSELNSFGLGDDVWATGTGLNAGTNSYKIYICPPDMTEGDNIITRCVDPSGTIELVSTDASGAFTTNPVKIWASANQVGEYDIIADYQSGASVGTYNSADDGIDYEIGVGFYVVPESVIAVALIALLVPGMIYIVRKRK